MLNKFEEISKIIEKTYKAELPVDFFNYENIKKWMTDVTNNCKNEIKKKFPEVPIRFSLYQQDAYEQIIAFLVFVLDDGPHFSIFVYTWNPNKKESTFVIKKINLEEGMNSEFDRKGTCLG